MVCEHCIGINKEKSWLTTNRYTCGKNEKGKNEQKKFMKNEEFYTCGKNEKEKNGKKVHEKRGVKYFKQLLIHSLSNESLLFSICNIILKILIKLHYIFFIRYIMFLKLNILVYQI